LARDSSGLNKECIGLQILIIQELGWHIPATGMSFLHQNKRVDISGGTGEDNYYNLTYGGNLFIKFQEDGKENIDNCFFCFF